MPKLIGHCVAEPESQQSSRLPKRATLNIEKIRGFLFQRPIGPIARPFVDGLE